MMSQISRKAAASVRILRPSRCASVHVSALALPVLHKQSSYVTEQRGRQLPHTDYDFIMDDMTPPLFRNLSRNDRDYFPVPPTVEPAVPPPCMDHAEGALKTVEFKIRYVTVPGEILKIVGNSPELGQWDIERGIQMTWNEGNIWTATVQVQPSRLNEFKCVLVNSLTNEELWEPGPNRQLDTSGDSDSSTSMQQEISWGSTETPEARTARLAAEAKKLLVAGSSTSADARTLIPVKLRMHYAAAHGEDIKIVGSNPGLGSWNVDQAVPLTWEEGDIWTTTLHMEPTQVSEFKFVVVNAKTKHVRWEIGADRQLDMSACPASLNSLHLEVAWDQTHCMGPRPRKATNPTPAPAASSSVGAEAAMPKQESAGQQPPLEGASVKPAMVQDLGALAMKMLISAAKRRRPSNNIVSGSEFGSMPMPRQLPQGC